MSKLNLLFLDETAVRIGIAPSRTLVAPGEQPYVVVEDTSSYARRYDMIACCSGDRVFPPIVYSPSERSDTGVKGINMQMLSKYINSILAQAIAALDRYPLVLVLDRATIHNCDKIKQSLVDGGCQDVAEVVKLPTQAAKRISPLDNALFNTWKQRIKNRAPITESNMEQIMCDEWNNLDARLIHSNYQHCLLLPRQNIYGDCPDPVAHKHEV
jgi:hypothetical protein